MTLAFDDKSLRPEVQDRSDVAMHELRWHWELGSQDPQLSVGTDEPDELDQAAARQRGRGREAALEQTRLEAEPLLVFVRGDALENGVAVMRVVEALEGARSPLQMCEVLECLRAEEALVEHIVEVPRPDCATALRRG